MATGTCMEQEATSAVDAPGIRARPSSLPTRLKTVLLAWRRNFLPPFDVAALLCFGAAMLSGVLLWACFQPLSLGSYFGWIALVPMLFLVRSKAPPRFLYDCAWVSGVVFFFPALQWLRSADLTMYASWALLTLYCSLYFPLALGLMRWLDRRNVPLLVSAPLVWVALEYMRSFFLTGFPWYLLAHTQHDFLPMIQMADLGGVFLVSAVVVAANAFLFEWIYANTDLRRWTGQADVPPRNLFLQGTAMVLVLGGAYGYGMYRLGQDRVETGPTVCLLQSDLDQRLRDDAVAPQNNGRSAAVVVKHFHELCYRAAYDHAVKPDLLIWPETSFPRPWVAVSPKLAIERVPEQWRDAEVDVRLALEDWSHAYGHVPHLLGINTRYLDHNLDDNHGIRLYNSALLLNAKGQVEGRFDKMHRVPFGEYVPCKDWLPFMKWFVPFDADFDYSIRVGEKFTRFALDTKATTDVKAAKYHFGVVICYEDTDPSLARQYVSQSTDGPPVDFLVSMSNDGWFNGTAEHEEHLAASRFRAIECRRAMVRAVNMGVSALIDGNGRVLQPKLVPGTTPPVWTVGREGDCAELPIADWHLFKKVSGILKATIPIDRRFSFYAVAGDWLPLSCWAVLTACLCFALARRRTSALSPLAGEGPGGGYKASANSVSGLNPPPQGRTVS